MAKTAYAAPQPSLRTPRSIEYDAFALVTARLKSAAPAQGKSFSALAEALYSNRRLWTLLAADVAAEGNTLPRDLRAQIFYLSEFTQEHSRKVLAGDETVDALVEINTAIMRGLSQKGGTP